MVDKVSNVIKEAIETRIDRSRYKHAEVKQWTNNVVKSCLDNQAAETLQTHLDLCYHAENCSGSPHGELLLLGQHHGPELQGEVHRVSVRAYHRGLIQKKTH